MKGSSYVFVRCIKLAWLFFCKRLKMCSKIETCVKCLEEITLFSSLNLSFWLNTLPVCTIACLCVIMKWIFCIFYMILLMEIIRLGIQSKLLGFKTFVKMNVVATSKFLSSKNVLDSWRCSISTPDTGKNVLRV